MTAHQPDRSSQDDPVRLQMLRLLDRSSVWDARGRRLSFDPPAPSVVVGQLVDDEPLAWTNRAVALAAPHRVVRGLAAVALLSGCERLMLALDRDDPQLRQRVELALQGTRVELRRLAPRTPLDRDSLLCDLAQQEQRSPLAAGLAGAMVLDAVVLHDVALALEGRRPMRRPVTVGGAVVHSAVVQAPLGTPLGALVEACGGVASEEMGGAGAGWWVWHNGLLRGRRAEQDDVVELDTRSLVVLPREHPLVLRSTTPLSDLPRRAAAACTGCRSCTDGCPVLLNGGGLQPHRVMRALASGWSLAGEQGDDLLAEAASCTGCGVCSLRCPARLDPARAVQALGGALASRGLPQDGRSALRPTKDRPGRRLSVGRAEEMLGVGRYRSAEPPGSVNLVPDRLRLPIQGPSGVPRVPTVSAGEGVAPGDTVAVSAAGSGEADIHSPLAGRVRCVDPDDGVVIDVR